MTTINADPYMRIGYDDRTGKMYLDGQVINEVPPGSLSRALGLSAEFVSWGEIPPIDSDNPNSFGPTLFKPTEPEPDKPVIVTG